MNAVMLIGLAGLLVVGPLAAQERKPVPKDSIRVSIAGCAKGYAFTTAHRPVESSDGAGFPEGMHLRMNGPKKTMGDIKAHRGSMIEITGIMKKGDFPEGVSLGGGVRLSPGPAAGSSITGAPISSQTSIDVESWRQIPGDCPR